MSYDDAACTALKAEVPAEDDARVDACFGPTLQVQPHDAATIYTPNRAFTWPVMSYRTSSIYLLTVAPPREGYSVVLTPTAFKTSPGVDYLYYWTRKTDAIADFCAGYDGCAPKLSGTGPNAWDGFTGEYNPISTLAPIVSRFNTPVVLQLVAAPQGGGSGMTGADFTAQAVPCGGGFFCATGNNTPAECPAGAYCPPASGAPVECPAGFECESSVDAPLPCSAGTFCAAGVAVGAACPASRFCPTGTALPRSCTAGGFCPRGSAAPTPCLRGSFCPADAAAPTLCPPGVWGNASGLSAPSCSGPCASSFFCPSGSTNASAALCPRGAFCPPGSGAPVLCPVGTWSNATGAASPATCAPCPAGTSTAAAGASAPAACAPCEPGTFSSGGVACSDCPQGHWCPGGTDRLPCAPGTYAVATASAHCIDCPSGTYEPAIRAVSCTRLCPPGTYRNRPGGASARACEPCEAGSYSLYDGQTACALCAPATASAAVGATNASTCAPCVGNTVAALAGAGACRSCDVGEVTTDHITCGPPTFIVPRNFMARSSAVPLAIADVVPLSCPPPLAPSASLTTCVGCSAGRAGAFPACAACTDSRLCPGATATSLHDLSATSAAPAVAAAAAACPTLTGALAGVAALAAELPPAVDFSGLAWLLNVYSADTTLLLGFTVAFAALVVYGAATTLVKSASPGRRALASRLLGWLESIDAFLLAVPVKKGESPVARPRALGGLFTVLGLVALVTMSLTVILLRAANNTRTVKSVDVLDTASRGAAKSLPELLTKPWGSGVQVRITASCDASAGGATLAWSSTDAQKWTFTNASCGAAEHGVVQLVFACVGCVLTPESGVTARLHHSCQALVVEAGALSAGGAVSAHVMSADDSAASAEGRLTSVTWTLAALLSVVNSTVSQPKSSRGYILLDDGSEAKRARLPDALAADGLGAIAISPLAAAVVVTVNLPLDRFFSNVVLSEASSASDLLAQLVGLIGIFGIFGTALVFIDTFMEAHQVVKKKIGRSRRSAVVPKDAQPGTGATPPAPAAQAPVRPATPPSTAPAAPVPVRPATPLLTAQSRPQSARRRVSGDAVAIGMPERMALASIGARLLTPAEARGAPPADDLDALAAEVGAL